MNMQKLGELEEKIGYHYRDQKLLRQAMTHTSFVNEQKINKLGSYERIEFLGDAVLEMISSEYFYHTYPEMPEGNLTKLRASSGCEQALAITARQLELGSYMLFGKGEEMTGGRDRDSIIADGVEAIIGSIYLDGGFEPAKAFILRFVLNDLETKQLFYDAKSILQEIVQNRKLGELAYELTGEEGPDHDKMFQTQALIDGRVVGTGVGRSKKLAEQKAAYEALLKLKEQEQRSVTEKTEQV